MDKLVYWDQRALLYLNHLGEAKWDGFWLYITQMEHWIPLYFVLALLFFHLWDWKRAVLMLVFLGLLVLCVDQLTNLIKHSVKRDRPCWDPLIGDQVRLVQDFCGGSYGFSSGHAANHFALAFFLGRLFRPQAPCAFYLLLSWAAVIAYSRVYVGVHYPLDILFGALLGLGLAFVFVWAYQKILLIRPA